MNVNKKTKGILDLLFFNGFMVMVLIYLQLLRYGLSPKEVTLESDSKIIHSILEFNIVFIFQMFIGITILYFINKSILKNMDTFNKPWKINALILAVVFLLAFVFLLNLSIGQYHSFESHRLHRLQSQ